MQTQQPSAMPSEHPRVASAAGMVPGIAAPGRGTSLPVTWAGSPWSLTGLSFLNFVLTVLTLGIYGFWGRTEVRKRIWSSIRLAGEPLEYTGTGKELFLGFLIVLFGVFLPLIVVGAVSQFAFGPKSGATAAIQLVLYVGFFYLVGVAMYRARRYRLSRTNWRGIRGALVGNSWAYGWTSFWTLLLLPATLVAGAYAVHAVTGPSIVGRLAGSVWLSGGILLVALIAWMWLVPWRATKLYRRITDDMTFGDRPFSFVGSAGPLYARFVARWIGVVILAVLTGLALWQTGVAAKFLAIIQAERLKIEPKPQFTTREIVSAVVIFLAASFFYSIITAWYRAAQANIFAAATRFEGVPLKLGVAAGGLIWLFVTNYVISTFTLGILRPVAEARSAKYFVERFAFDGPIDLARIAQSQAALGRTGEGLAQAFDVDAF